MRSNCRLPIADCRIAIVIIALPLLARAQDANPASLYGKDPTQGVYVRDSAVAVEKFALAERMERLKEWAKSADVYQEILQKYSDRVVPSQVDKENRIYQYASVGAAVQERLSKWPREGLDVYRGRYETEAAGLLQQAENDPAQLHKITALYFVTDASKAAALRLIDLYMENGDFPAAAWMGDRLLNWHPNLAAERPAVLYRTALAYHLGGNDAQAKSLLDALKKDFANAMGTIRGKEVVLSESLERELAIAHAAVAGSSGDSWPTAYGSADHARIPAVAGFGGAKLFGVELTRGKFPVTPGGMDRKQMEMKQRTDREAGMMTGVMPVVDRGELFFQDNSRIYAVSLDSGLPLPGWAQTYDGQRNGQYSTSTWSSPRNQQYTLSVTDDSVYAIMGQSDLFIVNTGIGYGRRDTRLVCLDRRTGKERWIARSQQLPSEALQQLELTGSPLVVGGYVYVAAHSSLGMQFEDCYVLCFDKDNGHFLWSCYVASANPRNMNWDGEWTGMAPNTPQLAYASGRIYALSNLGALAAIDAYDGTIIWLSIYPRDVSADQNMMLNRFRGGAWQRGDPSRTIKPWNNNPVIVADGKVFILATDSKFALVYDAGSGVEVKRIPLAEFDNASMLLAVAGEKLVLASGKYVSCVNWPEYDPAKPRDDNLIWQSSELQKRKSAPGDAVQGRPFVTTEAIFFPTQLGLFRISLKSGLVVDHYPPAGRSWDEDEGPGNVVVTQDHIILAGPTRVNVYTDLKLAMAKLDSAVAAAPDDPEPLLRYAEVMFVAGQPEIAVAKLDDAIRVAGGSNAMVPGAARERIFSNAMTFAQKLARDAASGNSGSTAAPSDPVAIVNGLLDRAAAAAYTPAQQVNYRMTRARLAAATRDYSIELKLLQEVLADAQWRAVPLAENDSGALAQAATVAERMISDIQRLSPELYAPFEQQAADALAAARTSADPVKLLSVAQVYPNAKVAPQALLAAADAYEVVKNHRQAAQILRQIYFKYPQTPDRLSVIEGLARNYLALPGHVDVAIARIAQGAKMSPDTKLAKPLALPDGKVLDGVSFADALTTLRQFHEQAVSRTLPEVRLPPFTVSHQPFLPQTPDSTITNVAALIAPLRDFERNDRIVTFAPTTGVSIFAPGANQPSFAARTFTEQPKNCAWVGPNLLVWSAGRMALITADKGEPVWDTQLKAIPIVEVATREGGDADNADDNDQPPPGPNDLQLQADQLRINGQVVIVQGQQLIVRRNGMLQRIQQLNPGGGVVFVPGGSEQIWQVRIVADRVLIGTSSGRLLSLDLADGKPLWQMRAGDRPIDRLLATDDFVAASVNDGAVTRLIAFDTVTGQVVFRKEFNNDPSGLVNAALAPDGKLVYLVADQLCCKDLFEPGDKLTFTAGSKRGDTPIYIGAIQRDQLLICEGRVLAVADNGQFVRVYSLETGKPVQTGPPEAARTDVDAGLQTMASSTWQVWMRSVGPRVYVWGNKTVVAYNLDQPEDTWREDLSGEGEGWSAREDGLMLGKDFLLLLDDAGGPGGPGGFNPGFNRRRAFARRGNATQLRLRAYNRSLTDTGKENGMQEQVFVISEPAGIIPGAWQAVDGGVYYLTADQKLHFLKGARN